MKRIYATLLSLAVLVPNYGYAQEGLPGVYISEVNWAGSALSTSDEWIELFNRTDQEVDLGGWILAGSATGGDALALPEGTVIGAESALVVANYGLESGKTAQLVEPQLVTSALSLPNADLHVVLMGPDGIVVDEATMKPEKFGGTAPFATMERVGTAWQTSSLTINLAGGHFGTPGVHIDASLAEQEAEAKLPPCVVTEEVEDEEPIEEPLEPVNVPTPEVEQEQEPETPVATKLKLSELMPNPLDGGEWVEIAHEGESAALLTGWQLVDVAGKHVPLDGIVEGATLHIVDLPTQILNNGGDSLKLVSPSGETVDETDYTGSPPEKGESWAFVGGAWVIATATPGKPNEALELEAESEEVTTDSLTQTESETEVAQPTVVAIAKPSSSAQESEPAPVATSKPSSEAPKNTVYTGTITAPPDLFGSQVAFISGYQLYFYHADWPALAAGDRVQVTGEETVSRGEKRIKIAKKEDLVVVGRADDAAQELSVSDAKQQSIGTLVRVSGEFVARTDRTLTLDQDGDLIDVTVHEGVDLDLKTLVGKHYAVTGIVRTLNGNVRIYPRSPDDLTEMVEEVPAASTEPASNLTISASTKQGISKAVLGGGFLAVVTALTGYWASKHYLTHKTT